LKGSEPSNFVGRRNIINKEFPLLNIVKYRFQLAKGSTARRKKAHLETENSL
jgi:hypothetical protein